MVHNKLKSLHSQVKISADDILKYFSYFFFLEIGDNLHEVPDPIFLGKIRKMSLNCHLQNLT